MSTARDKHDGLSQGDTATLARAFAPWAARVHGRLALRLAIAGATVGLVAGALGAALAWWLGHGALRPWAAALGVAGALAGLGLARKKRWRDEEVALLLDRSLASDEAIATAVELARDGGNTAAFEEVCRHAVRALARPRPRAMGPRVFSAWHTLGPMLAVAIAWLSIIALPPPKAQAAPPAGSEEVTLEELAGLKEALALSQLEAADAAQRERLGAISERARVLQEKLREGMARRDAQAELAKLRDDVGAERRRLGDGEERQGLEAALGKLSRNESLDGARSALGDRDLTGFDEEMQKLADRLESADRQKALTLLEEAAEAAKQGKSERVAKALEEQKKLLEERGRRKDALKELAKAFGDGLSPEAQEALRGMEGSGADSQELARALGRALEGMSESDRQKLAQRLGEAAKKLDPNTSDAMPLSKEDAERMQKQLASPEGQKQLAEQLKEWANQPPKSEQAERERALGETEERLREGEESLQAPIPAPGGGERQGGDKPGGSDGSKGGNSGEGNDGSGKGKSGEGNDGSGKGKGGGGKDGAPVANGDPSRGDGSGGEQDGTGGPSRGGGRGNHGGETAKIDGASVRARAKAKLNPGAPNAGTTTGRTAGRAGETAKTGGTGRLGEVGPDEVAGVESMEVPREYREHVSRYFPAK